MTWMLVLVRFAHHLMEVPAFGPVSGHLAFRHQMHGVEGAHLQRWTRVRSLALDHVIGHPVTGHAMLHVVRTYQQAVVQVHDVVRCSGLVIGKCVYGLPGNTQQITKYIVMSYCLDLTCEGFERKGGGFFDDVLFLVRVRLYGRKTFTIILN